jgi:DNA invertase Pin-like site-specific DNA recombinase
MSDERGEPVEVTLAQTGKHAGRWLVARRQEDGREVVTVEDKPPATRAMRAARRDPLGGGAAKARKKAGRQAEARKLRDGDHSVRYIARALGVHVRTVQRYLATQKTATDRETPD